MSPVAALKTFARRSALLVDWHRKISWRFHVLKDWWGTRVWRRTTVVETPLGFKLMAGYHPAYAMMRAGTFEPDETRLLQAMLSRGEVFIDVGANLGYYTCLASKLGNWCVAFEPQALNLRALTGNVRINGFEGRVEVFPLALADQPGILTLYGASGPSASLVQDWAGYSNRYRQDVPVSTLDIVCAQRFAGRRCVVKIDVEGAEFGVLRGATALLAQTPRPMWLVEICLDEFHPGGANPDYAAVFRLFFDAGYRAFAVLPDPVEVRPHDVEEWLARGRSSLATFNYAFVSSDEVEVIRGKAVLPKG